MKLTWELRTFLEGVMVRCEKEGTCPTLAAADELLEFTPDSLLAAQVGIPEAYLDGKLLDPFGRLTQVCGPDTPIAYALSLAERDEEEEADEGPDRQGT